MGEKTQNNIQASFLHPVTASLTDSVNNCKGLYKW